MAKLKLFHLLNQRSKRKQREQEQIEDEKYEAWSSDSRRKDSMEWIKPLIEDE